MKTFAEWVLPGHPDKLADTIADGLVDAAARQDPLALVGVEVAVHRDHVFVDGRIACPGAEQIDVEGIVRDVFRERGYGGEFVPDPDKVKIISDLCLGDLRPGEREIRTISDDQNIVTGYAEFNPSYNHHATAHWLAHEIGQHFDRLRREAGNRLGPDGKLFVVLDSLLGPKGYLEHKLDAVSFSVHHSRDVDTVELIQFAKNVLSKLSHGSWDEFGAGHWGRPEVIVNGAGDFAVGGPEGDNGLSGKKLVVDAYGPQVPIGGGALSGKDPHKIDRLMALRARQIAKHLVIAGVAERVLVQLAFAPGDREPRWKQIQFGWYEPPTGTLQWKVAPTSLAQRWLDGYDLSIEGSHRDLVAGRDFGWQTLARSAHFWDPALPWECWSPGAAK
jgi:S-adenosylmethionine synthetase